MKKAKINRTGAAAMAAAAIMFTGCIVDQQSIDSSGSGPGGSGGVDAVSFSLELPALQQVATRAEEGYSDGSFWENEIKLLTLLLCDPGPEGELLAMITPTFTSDDAALGSATTNATWTITAEIPIRPEPYDLLFVVNYDCSTLDGNGTLVVGEDTQTTIQERLTYSGILWDENNIIPMFGRLTNQTIADDNYTPTPTSIVELRRILARANVVVADNATTPGLRSKFSLTGIRTYNEAPLGHVVPNEAAMANPSLPSPTQSTDINGTVHNNLGDNVYEARRYFYENDKGVAYNGSNLTAWRKSPCIVIEGEYNGVRGWYRLDFVDGTTPLDIVRDHSYNFLITDVSGSGYPKPEYARDYPSTNISATVVPWTDHAISGPVNSQTYSVTVGSATGGTAIANYPQALAGRTIEVAAVPDDGYTLVGWRTVPERNAETGLALIPAAAPVPNPVRFTMPGEAVTVIPEFIASNMRMDLIMAPPGVIGIKKSTFDKLQAGEISVKRPFDLTIKGSSTYGTQGLDPAQNPWLTAVGPTLEDEPVYIVYFKWGSQVAMIGGTADHKPNYPGPGGANVNNPDTWSLDDVVWVNPEYNLGAYPFDDYDSFTPSGSISASSSNTTRDYNEASWDPALGHGDPCMLFDGWMTPTGNPWTAPVGFSSTTPFVGAGVGGGINIRAVHIPGDNHIYSVGREILLPNAGYRIKSKTDYFGYHALYWTSTAYNNSSGRSLDYMGSSVSVGAWGRDIGLPVRCVLIPPPPQVPPIDTSAKGNIIYFVGEGDDTYLSLGTWGNELDGNNYQSKMAVFKFGGIVGMDLDPAHTTFSSVVTKDPGTNAIRFNPMPDTNTITRYNNGTTVDQDNMSAGGTNNNVPGTYNPSDEIWKPAFNTYSTWIAGKGDPCQLLGLTANQLKEAFAADNTGVALQKLLDDRDSNFPEYAGWKTPTQTQNGTGFYGSASNGFANVTVSGAWNTSQPTDPGVMTFNHANAGGAKLPAAGFRTNSGGAVSLQGTFAYYWTSTKFGGTGGVALGLSRSTVWPAVGGNAACGYEVRCVR